MAMNGVFTGFSVRCAGTTLAVFALFSVVSPGQYAPSQTVIDLPTSKQMMLPVPGDPRRLNALPMTLAVSPDQRWVVSLNAGYGTFESEYMQSLAVVDTQTGAVKDFPEARTLPTDKQTFFSGLAFSADGTRLYASMASSTDAEGDGKRKSGNGIAVYRFAEGVITPQRFLPLPLVDLPAGRHTSLLSNDGGSLSPFPTGIAVVPGAVERLLVAENLSDSVALVNAQTGAVEKMFDVSVAENVPSAYPIALAVTKDGTRGFVALWNASEVMELDLVRGAVVRHVDLLKPKSPIAPGTHPCELMLDERAGTLYVALSNRDAVAAVTITAKKLPALEVRGYFDTRLPGQSYFGAEPNGLAMSADGSRVYVANMGSDAVAVLDTRKLKSVSKAKGMVEPIGFVPTELMPMALASVGGKLYVTTDKGKGTGPNGMLPQVTEALKNTSHLKLPFTYVFYLLHGSLAVLDEAGVEAGMKASTDVVMTSNRMKAADETMQFAAGKNPIKHVIYIVKENRTYDQIFGDLKKDGKAVGNGDPSLAMYGADVTPNQHKLVLQFGVLDNFFDSGEVSGQGHVWSNAAIGTDYLEKTIQQNYRSAQRTYDYEGMVADGYPLLQHIPDLEEPASGYIWTDLAAHGRTTYNFGEYVSSVFCNDKNAPRVVNPTQGAMSGSLRQCADPVIKPGSELPAEWGGGKNLWPWAIPRLASNIATKPELVGNFAKEYPDFNLRVPDQLRINVLERHLEGWKKERAAGRDAMPNFIEIRLGNDHTAGTTAGGPTPKSSVADNDLAVGRVVDAVSHSAYWDDTAIFILEDDAQNGGDHVDAHRSLAIIASKYAPRVTDGAFVDSRFYSTVSVLRTMEKLLDVPPMNNNDALASLISTLFTGAGTQAAFAADFSNRDNGLIYAANAKTAVGAAESAKMDFRHADRADSDKLNLILWQDAMGDAPPPHILLEKHPKKKDDDD